MLWSALSFLLPIFIPFSKVLMFSDVSPILFLPLGTIYVAVLRVIGLPQHTSHLVLCRSTKGSNGNQPPQVQSVRSILSAENLKTVIKPGQFVFYCYHALSTLNNASNKSPPTCRSKCHPPTRSSLSKTCAGETKHTIFLHFIPAPPCLSQRQFNFSNLVKSSYLKLGILSTEI